MLKRYSVENFTSFSGSQILDLTAGTTKLLPEHTKDFGKVKLLKTAVIYGANASGKSNLIKSIEFASKIVVKGLDKVDTYKKHFRLDKENSDKVTSFSFEIELNNKFFDYSFSILLKDNTIKEEWLYEIGSKPERIFERDEGEIKLGRSLIKEETSKNRFEIYSEDISGQKDQLFLNEIATKKLTFPEAGIFNGVFDWFKNKLTIVYPGNTYDHLAIVNRDLVETLSKHLEKFDTGVNEISTIEEDFEEAFRNFPSELRTDVLNELNNTDRTQLLLKSINSNMGPLKVYKDGSGEIKVSKLGFVHGEHNNEIFEVKDESDGTRRLLDFIPLISKFDSNHTILIDEFDRSLHPKLTREYFKLFFNDSSDESQLIVTTHESTLLDLDLIRRDEIWFVEKSKGGDSKLYSLNKFQVRYDSKIEKAYLLGRYGAIPMFEKLFSCCEEK